jgi:transposase
MFARKIQNRSGSISVQVIQKEKGRYRVVRTIGTAHDPDEVERLWRQAHHFIYNHDPYQKKLFSLQTLTDQNVQCLMETLSNASIRTIGPELIFGALFERIGLNQIPDEWFRHLVIARLAYPTSKLKTVDYLHRYQGVAVSVGSLYALLDRLHNRYKQQVERIVYQHTQKLLRTITVVFYDMTTLYFETEDEDDWRRVGFSKDGKFQHPQIMLGLLVGEGGLPIGYDLFEGNTFEGHTLLPTLQQIQEKYGFPTPIVVADAAMLSKTNLQQLASAHYSFIIGARIKNESESLKHEILQKADGMKPGDSMTLRRSDGTRLIVTYSEKRAHNDAKNRQKGLARLEKQVKTGRLTKQSINNRGYNKFLRIEGDITVRIDENKVEEDKRWDGLKGYLTNTQLRAKKVVENYSHLWQIEKAFRISKTDLRIRPIYHSRKRRIEAHLCIAFAAYAIYKELERLLKKKKVEMSAKRAGELTHTMYELHYTLPDSNEPCRLILKMDKEQQILFDVVYGK